jgi:hypothetical protein
MHDKDDYMAKKRQHGHGGKGGLRFLEGNDLNFFDGPHEELKFFEGDGPALFSGSSSGVLHHHRKKKAVSTKA